MTESNVEPSLAKIPFETTLSKKVELYADAKHQATITFGKEVVEESQKLRGEILNDCAEELSISTERDEIMKIIDRKLVWYASPSGVPLLPGNEREEFYRDLVMKVLDKASSKP